MFKQLVMKSKVEIAPQTAQHTPGPWKTEPSVDNQRINLFGVSPNNEYHIGTLVGASQRDLQILKANARLIAAAPKLLEALKKCVVWNDVTEAELQEARAAIAEAEGH